MFTGTNQRAKSLLKTVFRHRGPRFKLASRTIAAIRLLIPPSATDMTTIDDRGSQKLSLQHQKLPLQHFPTERHEQTGRSYTGCFTHLTVGTSDENNDQIDLHVKSSKSNLSRDRPPANLRRLGETFCGSSTAASNQQIGNTWSVESERRPPT